jgi:HEAT repeat protein
MTVGQRLTGLAGIRDGETPVVWRIAVVFAVLEAGRALGEVGANALLVHRQPELLPGLFIPLGLASMVVSLGFGAALARVPRARLFGGTLIVIAIALIALWLALEAGMDVVALTWLTVMAASAMAFTISWTAAGSSLDARQAKRLFPLCTAAAIVGYLVGSLAAGPLAAVAGSASLLAADALLLVLGTVGIVSLARRSTGSGWRLGPSAASSLTTDLLAGFETVRRSPLLGRIAVAYVLLAVLLFSVSYPYLVAAGQTFDDEAELTSVLGLVSAVVTILSFVVALVVANRFYARFGVAAAALLLPIVYFGGFLVWIVRFTFPTAAGVTIVQQVTQRGLSNAAWSAFYNVVPATRRAQVNAFMDGVPGQLGIVLAGVLQLTAGRLLLPEQVAWLGLLAAALCIAVVVAIRRRYAEELIRTLRSGVGEQLLAGGPGSADMLAVPEVRTALASALRAEDGATRGLAASLLVDADAPEARADLSIVLDDPDPMIAGEAVVGLLRDAGVHPAAEGRLARLLDGDELERVVGLRCLYRLSRPLPPERRAAALEDAAPTCRAMALTMLVGADDPAATDALIASLSDPLPIIRRAAAATLSARPTTDPRILACLASADPDEQDAALLALEGHGQAVREPVLAWAEQAVSRATTLLADRAVVRQGLGRAPSDAPTGSQAVPPAGSSAASASAVDELDEAALRALLDDILVDRIGRQQQRVLGAMAVLGAPETRTVIRRCLRSPDGDVRAQALEALDSVGDRRLGRALTRLVEASDPSTGTAADADTAWRRLRDDADPWIGPVARRIQAAGGTMPDDARALGDLETMLRLRRVPLFGRLSPEDLQRIAHVATERWFEPGQPLVREGELGDELFVILDGRVIVTRHEPDGTDRRIRTYESGDHIGELAVLRERPRAATVTAEGRVLTLVIGGEGLMAILRERPEAAMAMLATLAERISAQ